MLQYEMIIAKDIHSIKKIVNAIELYYEGKPVKQICKKFEIEPETFSIWIAEYSQIAIEFMELRKENEALKKILMHLTGKCQEIDPK